MDDELEAPAVSRMHRVCERYGCSSETAWRYLDLREEGYPQHQAALMAGLTDPPEDS